MLYKRKFIYAFIYPGTEIGECFVYFLNLMKLQYGI